MISLTPDNAFFIVLNRDLCQNFWKLKKSFSGWILFIALSIIWGSSFVLMKLGMQALTAIQVASIRISSAAIVLLPFALTAFKNIS